MFPFIGLSYSVNQFLLVDSFLPIPLNSFFNSYVSCLFTLVCLPVSVFPVVCLSFYSSVSLSVYVYLPIRLSVHPCVCLSMFICQSVCHDKCMSLLSVYICISLCQCMYVCWMYVCMYHATRISK